MPVGPVKQFFHKVAEAPVKAAHYLCPTKEVAGEKAIGRISWIGETISSPHNRCIMGVTALASQPFIDLNNKDVDKDTRVVSCARTMGKIISGTITGVAIRALAIEVIKKFSVQITKNGEVKTPKINLFTPKKFNIQEIEKYIQYQKTIGTFLGILVMVYTNFAIDKPMTIFLTNYFTDKFKKTGVKPPIQLNGGKK